MGNTKILYEQNDKVEMICQVISHVVINTKTLELSEENEDKNKGDYENLVVITTYENAKENIKKLGCKDYEKVCIVVASCSLAEMRALTDEMDMEFPMEESQLFAVNTRDEAFKAAEKIQNLLGKAKRTMPEVELEAEIEIFLKKHNTCALATGSGNKVRCTPIEYIYDKKCLYLITEGGKKFLGLLRNPSVSIAVFDPYKSMADLQGLQITGKATVVKPMSEEFIYIFEKKNIKQEVLKNLKIDMNVVKIVPSKFEILSSSFRVKEYDARQQLVN